MTGRSAIAHNAVLAKKQKQQWDAYAPDHCCFSLIFYFNISSYKDLV